METHEAVDSEGNAIYPTVLMRPRYRTKVQSSKCGVGINACALSGHASYIIIIIINNSKKVHEYKASTMA